MMEGIFIGVAFLLTSTVATTIVPSLPLPLAYAPVMLAGGLLVMNRFDALSGAVWIMLGGMLLAAAGADGGLLPALVAAVAGMLLSERVFAARSVYALLGLGLSTGTLFVLTEIAIAAVSVLTGDAGNIGRSLGQGAWQLLLLLVLLHASFAFLLSWRRVVYRVFVIR